MSHWPAFTPTHQATKLATVDSAFNATHIYSFVSANRAAFERTVYAAYVCTIHATHVCAHSATFEPAPVVPNLPTFDAAEFTTFSATIVFSELPAFEHSNNTTIQAAHKRPYCKSRGTPHWRALVSAFFGTLITALCAAIKSSVDAANHCPYVPTIRSAHRKAFGSTFETAYRPAF